MYGVAGRHIGDSVPVSQEYSTHQRLCLASACPFDVGRPSTSSAASAIRVLPPVLNRKLIVVTCGLAGDGVAHGDAPGMLPALVFGVPRQV
jgi:hypothetical protein